MCCLNLEKELVLVLNAIGKILSDYNIAEEDVTPPPLF